MTTPSMVQCPKCSAQNAQGSRFCNSCGEAFSSPSQMPTAESPKAQAETPHVARIISSDSIPAGGFTPGTILADRYRIIGLLGRGGMGEVYRADDLKLGQPVALKFLPPKLADDPVRRERFFAEVRITRQLSHPNICRVYDIGEIDGRHFLSMEYIDGEDLASLIKRIGHLSNEKALDIARQLAAGLAAAHERGVLHRDLKPANIMLDGHGRIRVTDFGLAIAAEDTTQAAEIAGTPAYMAPEQLAGKGATVRSDMYSLGLVLYEIYTGKKAFTARTLAELRQQKEIHTPRAISELREGMDPVVERLIRRCMERDPNARPSSVAQLALALPGGDPLAAALAAGETPSPEMVAASGSKEGLRPAVAWGLLAFIIVGTLAIMAMNDRFVFLHRRIPFEKAPEALVERSHEIIKKAGYSERFADSAYGFEENSDMLRYFQNADKSANRWKSLDAKAILFWYRQSPRPLEVPLSSQGMIVTPNNPPLQFSGEVLVMLDTEGRLVSLRAVPPQVQPSTGTPPAPDWAVFFAEAGLDTSQWTPTDARWSPPSYADTRTAWQGPLPNRPRTPVRIEAAAFRGKAVSFEIIAPWTRAADMEPFQRSMAVRVSTATGVLFIVAVIVGGVFFARSNVRLGRGDRRSATRLAILVSSLLMLSLTLGAHHVLTLWELGMVFISASISLFVGGLFWILYIALEPFVRRRWPQILVSWTRLLSGEWRDPLIARDAFAGCVFVVLAICIYRFTAFLVPSWFGSPGLMAPVSLNFVAILGSRFFVSQLLIYAIAVCFLGWAQVCLLFVMRTLLRNKIAAIATCILVSALMFGSGWSELGSYWVFAVQLVLAILYFFVLIRFGLIALAIYYLSVSLFYQFPITLDASAWYSGYGFAALAIFAAIVLYAFRYSLGGRPLIAPSHLDD
jgi:serine/threonine protein kinase